MPLSRPDEGRKKPIVITSGEPSGIRPEIAVKAFCAFRGGVLGYPLRLIGNRGVFRVAAKVCGLNFAELEDAIVDIGDSVPAEPGKPIAANAAAVTGAIEEGVRACDAREAAAL